MGGLGGTGWARAGGGHRRCIAALHARATLASRAGRTPCPAPARSRAAPASSPALPPCTPARAPACPAPPPPPRTVGHEGGGLGREEVAGGGARVPGDLAARHRRNVDLRRKGWGRETEAFEAAARSCASRSGCGSTPGARSPGETLTSVLRCTAAGEQASRRRLTWKPFSRHSRYGLATSSTQHPVSRPSSSLVALVGRGRGVGSRVKPGQQSRWGRRASPAAQAAAAATSQRS